MGSLILPVQEREAYLLRQRTWGACVVLSMLPVLATVVNKRNSLAFLYLHS